MNSLQNYAENLNRLDRSIHFSAAQVAGEVESILSSERGYAHQELTKVFADIQIKSKEIARRSSKKGLVGNFIDKIMNGKEKLLAETQTLKTQIESVELLIDDQMDLINTRLPQMQNFYTHFSTHNKAMTEDLEIAENMKEALEDSLQLLDLEMQENPKLESDYEHRLKINETKNELKLVNAKIEQIEIQRGFFYHMAQDTLNSIDVARQLQKLLQANKETMLPMFRFTAVSSVINRELQQGIDTVKTMREGFTTIFKETAQQNIENMVRTSEIGKEGLLNPELLIELANKMEDAQRRIAQNEREAQRLAEERNESAKLYVEKMAKMNSTRSGEVLNTLAGEEKFDQVKAMWETLSEKKAKANEA